MTFATAEEAQEWFEEIKSSKHFPMLNYYIFTRDGNFLNNKQPNNSLSDDTQYRLRKAMQSLPKQVYLASMQGNKN
jgi:hypothetical protein